MATDLASCFYNLHNHTNVSNFFLENGFEPYICVIFSNIYTLVEFIRQKII